MSSRSLLRALSAMRPGSRLVVEGGGLEASMQDADKPVGQPLERVVVFDSAGAEVIVEGAGAGRSVQGPRRPAPSAHR
jgi:hypothetical protein